MACPCLSIDDLTLRYGVPDILFIDVEGFEVNGTIEALTPLHDV